MLGNIISAVVYLTPLPIFYKIYLKNSTEGFQATPYLVAFFSSVLWLFYGILKKDALLLITINAFGCITETIYITMFVLYAPRASKISTLRFFALVNVGLFTIVLLIIQLGVRESSRVQVLGWICDAVSVTVFAAPLSIVGQVIRTRSVEFMPFYLSFFLTLSAVVWFLYGLSVKDMRIAVPNILGLVLGLTQMGLYGVYRNSKKVEEERPPEETEGATEVSPEDAQPVESGGDAPVHEEGEAHDRSTVEEIRPA